MMTGSPAAPTARMPEAARRIEARCAELLAERDRARLARVLATTIQLLPSKMDAPDDNAAEGWLHLLGDLPIWAAEAACVQYARQNKWRPAPSEIIEIAERIARPVKELA